MPSFVDTKSFGNSHAHKTLKTTNEYRIDVVIRHLWFISWRKCKYQHSHPNSALFVICLLDFRWYCNADHRIGPFGAVSNFEFKSKEISMRLRVSYKHKSHTTFNTDQIQSAYGLLLFWFDCVCGVSRHFRSNAKRPIPLCRRFGAFFRGHIGFSMSEHVALISLCLYCNYSFCWKNKNEILSVLVFLECVWRCGDDDDDECCIVCCVRFEYSIPKQKW